MKNVKLGFLGAYLVSVLLMVAVLTVPVIGIIYWVGEEINLITILTMLLVPSMVSGIFIAFTLHLKKIREENMVVEEEEMEEQPFENVGENK